MYLRKHKHDVFDHLSFYDAFASDLRAARALVLIQSPFIADRRIRKLQHLVTECIRRRVRVCVFVQRPVKWHVEQDFEVRLASVERTSKLLSSLGVHVAFRERVHEKLATIDERILWEGSLNILSHNDSFERMTRWVDRRMVQQAITTHKLNSCDLCCRRRKSPLTLLGSEQLIIIGDAIAKRRKLLGISQVNLAERSGIAQPVISQIEAGKREIGITKLIRICKELDLELRAMPWFLLPAIDELHQDF